MRTNFIRRYVFKIQNSKSILRISNYFATVISRSSRIPRFDLLSGNILSKNLILGPGALNRNNFSSFVTKIKTRK